MAEQLPLKESVERSIRSGLTKKEIESDVGAALAAPASADSAAKAKSKSAESRRSFKKKFETLYVKTQFNIGLEMIDLFTFYPR